MGISPIDRNQIDTIQNRITKTYKALSSGKKDTGPSETAMADRLEGLSRGLQTAMRNLDFARGTLDVAQSGLGEISDRLSRVKELTLQYKNTSNADDQATIKEEIDAELAQIDQISGQEYEGQAPLQSSGSTTVQVGDDAQDTVNFASTNASTSAEGLKLSDYDPASDTALADIDAAASKVGIAQAQFASSERRFESIENSLMNRIEAAESARSRIEDVDVADAMSQKTRDEILQKGQVALIAQANANSGNSFLRILQSGSRPRISGGS